MSCLDQNRCRVEMSRTVRTEIEATNMIIM